MYFDNGPATTSRLVKHIHLGGFAKYPYTTRKIYTDLLLLGEQSNDKEVGIFLLV